jgi:RNA polymerase sigma-70 factor (sigma-E family)
MTKRQERDRDFGEYVAERRAHLYRTAYLLCGDGHRAEDIVQQALTKLYAAWPRASRLESVDAYARRIVVNAHIDETRRPWRRERPVEPDPGSALDRPVEDAVGPEDSDALWTALRGLAPGQRRVVVLRHYWGLSVDETAADLGISPGTVKSQTSDALARLRDALSVAATPGEQS